MGLINEYGYDITNQEQRAERMELVREKAELYSVEKDYEELLWLKLHGIFVFYKLIFIDI